MPWFSFIKGYQIKSYERGTFQDCQMCTKSHCSFKNCHYILNSSIFCQSISDTSQSQVPANITMSKECLTTGNYDTNKSPSSDDIQQMSSNFVLSHKAKILFETVKTDFLTFLTFVFCFYLMKCKLNCYRCQ